MNGRPNQSLEPTAVGKTPSAAQLQRYAALGAALHPSLQSTPAQPMPSYPSSRTASLLLCVVVLLTLSAGRALADEVRNWGQAWLIA